MINLFRKLRGKYLLWVLAWSTLAFGQGSQTVYTTIAINTAATGVLPVVPRNIGQSFHLLSVTPYNLGGCAAWTGLVRLQGSYDNIVWSNVGNAVTAISATIATPIIASGSGSYPYLRVNVIATTVNCSLDVVYSGNVNGQQISNTQSAVNDGFQFASASGNGFGVLTNAGTGVACGPSSRLVLYSLSVINGAATAATTTARVKVINSVTLVAEKNFFLFGLGAGQVLSLPNGPRPIYISSIVPAAQGIDLVFDQAAGDGLNITAVARCE